MRDAYDIPMAEFLDRLRYAFEFSDEDRNGGTDPLMAHLKEAHRLMSSAQKN